MSSKKRKGNLPETSTIDASLRPTAPRNEKLSLPNPKMDDDGDESSEHSMMRAQLAAALLEIEHLRAAASEPCVRCHFYSDWTVRVRTMGGHVYTIACPDGPKTLVAHVKQKLAQFDPKCHILQQVTLVLPCEASSSSSSADRESTDAALEDDRTLKSYDLPRRDILDLFLVDMNWSSKCLEAIAFIKGGGQTINFESDVDDDTALAVSWALVNAVNPDLSSLRFARESITAGGLSKICAALCALSNAECLQVGPRIGKLCIQLNDIGDAGAHACSELMRVSSWLKELSLVICGISSAGAVSIGSALRASASHQLQILNFRYNHIGLDGAKSIGAALTVNTSLTEMNLSGTGMDISELEVLAEALKVNCGLRKLYIDDNKIDSAGADFLADALKLKSSLRCLHSADATRPL